MKCLSSLLKMFGKAGSGEHKQQLGLRVLVGGWTALGGVVGGGGVQAGEGQGGWELEN